MPEVCKDQRTEAWHDARRGKITASLAGAILDLDPHKGQLAAFNEILGLTQQKESRHMAWGRKFEPQARSCYEGHTGNLVTETGFWIHPQYPWLGASPDGLIGEDGILEVKCPTKLPEAIPRHHECQMRIQMACTGRTWGDYFVWIYPEFSDEPQAFLKRIVADEWGDPELIRNLELWYEAHVKTGTPPKRKKAKAK